RQADQFQQPGDHFPPPGRLNSVTSGEKGEIFLGGQPVVHPEKIGHVTDYAPHLVGMIRHIPSVDPGPAFARGEQRGQDGHGRRLAGAVGTDKPVGRSFSHFKVEGFDRLHIPKPFRQILRSDHRTTRPSTSRRGPAPGRSVRITMRLNGETKWGSSSGDRRESRFASTHLPLFQSYTST